MHQYVFTNHTLLETTLGWITWEQKTAVFLAAQSPGNLRAYGHSIFTTRFLHFKFWQEGLGKKSCPAPTCLPVVMMAWIFTAFFGDSGCFQRFTDLETYEWEEGLWCRRGFACFCILQKLSLHGQRTWWHLLVGSSPSPLRGRDVWTAVSAMLLRWRLLGFAHVCTREGF